MAGQGLLTGLQKLGRALKDLPEEIKPISALVVAGDTPRINVELEDFFHYFAGHDVIYEKGHFRIVWDGVEYNAMSLNNQGPWNFVLPARNE
jgi:hypothetical protein